MRSLAAALALVFASSCTTSSPPREEHSDASVAPVRAAAGATRVLGVFGKLPAFAGRLGEGGRLVASTGGFRVARGFRATGTSGLVTIAPTRASEPLRIVDEQNPQFSVEVRDESLASIDGEVQGGAVVYPAAAAGVDVAQIVEPTRVEELRLLADARPYTVRYRLGLGAGVSDVRLRGERVEIYDRSGLVRVASEPMFAVDAAGTRRTPTLALTGTGAERTLTVTLDATGLVAPIALDPTWQLTSNSPGTGYGVPIVAVSPTDALLFATGSTSPVWSYDAKTDKWTSRSITSAANRSSFAAALVPSLNKVLVAGGSSGGGVISSAEVYSFAGGTYGTVATGSMAGVRYNHAMVVVGGYGTVPERVLAIGGGSDSSTRLASVEAWDPGTGTWGSRASLSTARENPTATVFMNGGKQYVLVAGGRGAGDFLSSAEVYDVEANTWSSPTNNLGVLRNDHTSTLLPNGKILIAGGGTSTYCCPVTETTRLYDPATNTFTAGPSMAYQRRGHGAVVLTNGKVLIAGGNGRPSGSTGGNSSLSTAEMYDPVTNTFESTPPPSLTTPRENVRVVPLSSNRALFGPAISGGGYVLTTEVFYGDPVSCTGPSTGCSNCVDGFCCDSACTGQCQACDVTGREGVCTWLNGEAPHGSRATCTPFVTCSYSSSTGTSACATSCVGDTACNSTSYCSTGSCVAKKIKGAACGASNECTSGFCVDGFCCESACTGQCQACGEVGKEGSCVAVDGAPRGTRTACPTSGFGCSAGSCASACTKDAECVSANYCNTTSSLCVPKLANGSTCTASTQCSSGNCIDGYCCNSTCTSACYACGPSGTCTAVPAGPPKGTRTCGAYTTCNGSGACSTTCASDSDCAATYYCNTATSKCAARKVIATACTSNSECTSGFCAQGVCCSAACTGECEACNQAGFQGTCKAKSSGTACGVTGCVGGYTVGVSACDGTSSTCPLGAITPCPNGLKCLDKSTCKSACAADADCVSGSCDTSTGKCVASWDGGLPDTGADTFVADTFVPDTADTAVADTFVADTFVADTFVADTFVPDAGEDGRPIADVGGSPPFKGKTTIDGDFTRCAKNADCSSGFCVEGVCCDSACGERCHSCALLTSPGKCTVEPIGVDLKSECGPALSCLGTCGGGSECIGAGEGTLCARNRCVNATKGVGAAYCASPGGKCNTEDAVPFDCGAYICEPAFGACRTTCTRSDDCAQGYVCDLPTKSCIVAPVPTGDTGDDGGGGCAFGASPRSGELGLVGLAALAFLGARRRRR